MLGHFGFSYVGLIFLLMLTTPNLIWTKMQPNGYNTRNENKVLLFFERTGQVLVTCTALIFSDFNLHKWSSWSWWLIAAIFFMILYECWWIRYFRSNRTLEDFYSSFLCVPVAGATLPIVAFLLLGVYGKVIWMIISVVILGIGHIGIHLQHKKEIVHSK
ncbi:hypothetical protein [Bacillus massiliigorillae]|uniref:hypothetical protein n=1 Tax=Bacillus massiliigorillae TaxID=1243664 RepID=UPI00039BB75E|nr:hypothetical protein [Bacillus massiliigorillae]